MAGKTRKKRGFREPGAVETRRAADGKEVTVKFAPGAKERLGGIDLDALLYDVAGIMPADHGAVPNREWEYLDFLPEPERARELEHTFSIENIGARAGWEYPEVTLDGFPYHYHVSCIGHDVASLVACVQSLESGGHATLCWQNEPGVYVWRFSRRGDILYVEVPKADEGVYFRYDYFLGQIMHLLDQPVETPFDAKELEQFLKTVLGAKECKRLMKQFTEVLDIGGPTAPDRKPAETAMEDIAERAADATTKNKKRRGK